MEKMSDLSLRKKDHTGVLSEESLPKQTNIAKKFRVSTAMVTQIKKRCRMGKI